MKTSKYSIWLVATAITGPAIADAQSPLGAAFTYQGQLKYDGLPVTDMSDFRFSLWDASTLGNPVSATLVFDGQIDNPPPIAVVDGLFTVVLDFGPDIFTGQARWLEIEVRSPHDPTDTLPYTLLNPRQEMTPTAYALHAPSAASVPWDGIANVPPGFADGIDDDALGVLVCGPGEVAKWDDVSGEWACADDLTGEVDAWLLTGNAGTTPGVDFLGTTDNVTLEIRVNNTAALRIEPTVDAPNLIGGDAANYVTPGASRATIAGGGSSGYANRVTDWAGTVSGGIDNQAGDADGATDNKQFATVGGGRANTASGGYSTVGGGINNAASGDYGSTVAGGWFNTASGDAAMVPGGSTNIAEGNYSFAAGQKAWARHNGAFVWADSSDPGSFFESTGDNQFLIRASGGVGIGTADPDSPMHVVADFPGTADLGVITAMNTATSGAGAAVYGQNNASDGSGIAVKGVGGSTGVRGIVSPTGSLSYTGVAGEVHGGSGANNGVYATASGTWRNWGVYGSAWGGTENRGGYFSAGEADGIGVYGEAYYTGAGTTYGGYFTAEADGGIGVKGIGEARGVEGVVNPTGSATYTGVHGSATGGTGTNYGVYGYASTDYPLAPDENAYGGYFLSTGERVSSGVFGRNTAYDVDGHLGYVGSAAEFPMAAGVYGAEAASGYGYAGYFSGDVEITGNLHVSGASKTFKIDHPLDPANKYLYHACVESDERLNVYNGNVELDGRGKALVELPDWFEALNRDFRYQLTAIGAPGPNLHVGQEIADNHFSIAGGAPGTKVSWQVTGIRNDPCAAASPFKVEVDKPEVERGTYLAPEAWGQPEEMGLHYEERQKRGSRLPDKEALEETE